MPKTTSSPERITRLLLAGKSTREVAASIGCSVRWVNNIASERGLPRNVRIAPFGKTEAQILRALVASNMAVSVVARAFSQAPSNIQRVIEDVRKRTPKT